MKFVPLHIAAAALLLSQTPAVRAAPGGEPGVPAAIGNAYLDTRQPAPRIRVPGPRNIEAVPVQLAQASDPRVMQLEEQIRQLNGQLEELNFQVLQMQEQIRKMQEDNEFRFQELEGKRTDAGGSTGRTARPDETARSGQIEEIIETPGGMTGGTIAAPADPGTASPRLGEPPRTFGRITLDAQGNVLTTAPGDLPGVQTGPARPDNTTVAALPPTNDPEELYRNSYEFILSGDYGTAEAGFRDHIARFPDDKRAADAQFWLGEALLAQGKNREAAQTFLAANRDHPDSKKAPETMLKLGISLAAMKQRDVACATFAEIGRRYPQASPAVLDRAKKEQAAASC